MFYDAQIANLLGNGLFSREAVFTLSDGETTAAVKGVFSKGRFGTQTVGRYAPTVPSRFWKLICAVSDIESVVSDPQDLDGCTVAIDGVIYRIVAVWESTVNVSFQLAEYGEESDE